MRDQKSKFLALSPTFVFLVHFLTITCQLIEAKPPESLVEQSLKSDLQLLQLLLDPAEEFVKDLLEDFRSQLSDGTFHLL